MLTAAANASAMVAPSWCGQARAALPPPLRGRDGVVRAPRIRNLLRLDVRLPQRVHHAEILDLDVVESAVLLLHAPHIDVLDHLTRLGIDQDRAPDAVRVLPMREEVHRLVAGELAA